jgi:hypothetical protein
MQTLAGKEAARAPDDTASMFVPCERQTCLAAGKVLLQVGVVCGWRCQRSSCFLAVVRTCVPDSAGLAC